jgi:hypothetical protein
MTPKKIRSEEVSKRYFESLGFKIRDRDFEGRKKGTDFFIEHDGCIQSVEARTKMGRWTQLLKPQLDRLRNGGLVVLVNGEQVYVNTKDDIEEIQEVTVYRVVFKKSDSKE